MKLKLILLILLLLMVFGGYAYGVKPREAGIGFKYSYTQDSTYFRGSNDDTWYIKDDNNPETPINKPGTTQVPIFVQLDEELLGDFSFTNWFIDLTRLIQTDHPPNLVGTSYDALVRSETFVVPTENTYTKKFSHNYPQYSSIIDNASNPSLSADYYITKIAAGKTWGVFLPLGEQHRLATLGAGIGINYIEGSYAIFICDPFFISSNVRKVSISGEFREAFCLNNSKLFSQKINHFSIELNFPFKLYSYIGDDFEFNIWEIEIFYSPASGQLETPLIPHFQYQTLSQISVLAHF